ncbi:hypothetical protein LP419_13060 [Massilia sp. H-1]|nr:hypothetical protein LP419_13060 [Massilia sp. H-1]
MARWPGNRAPRPRPSASSAATAGCCRAPCLSPAVHPGALCPGALHQRAVRAARDRTAAQYPQQRGQAPGRIHRRAHLRPSRAGRVRQWPPQRGHRQPPAAALAPGLIGSITHNGQYAAALVCPASALLGVGIDIESVVSDDARQAMTELVVSADEAAFLRECAKHARLRLPAHARVLCQGKLLQGRLCPGARIFRFRCRARDRDRSGARRDQLALRAYPVPAPDRRAGGGGALRAARRLSTVLTAVLLDGAEL